MNTFCVLNVPSTTQTYNLPENNSSNSRGDEWRSSRSKGVYGDFNCDVLFVASKYNAFHSDPDVELRVAGNPNYICMYIEANWTYQQFFHL